uniref:Uncharacterized protein n=1 Tax=Parascaris univalens TaxID=6257 RepID=A0A915BB62_PARUN
LNIWIDQSMDRFIEDSVESGMKAIDGSVYSNRFTLPSSTIASNDVRINSSAPSSPNAPHSVLMII